MLEQNIILMDAHSRKRERGVAKSNQKGDGGGGWGG